jgi:energy-coupling factor transport system ATP-binding protein
MIQLEEVWFSYSSLRPPVLRAFNLKIESFSWVAITGPDGSGKTTLGKLIKGLLKPDSGSIAVAPLQPGTAATVGYLGGDPYDSLVGLTVEEDIVFGMENLGLSPAEMRVRLEHTLGWSGLVGMEQRLVNRLSGGEQQKVALAGMLAMGARILILDEALGMLDRSARFAIRSLLAALRHDPGLTIIETTHNLEEILSTDRVLFMSDGTLQFNGSPEEFLESPLGRNWASMTGGLAALRAELYSRGVISATQACSSDLRNSLINIINKS